MKVILYTRVSTKDQAEEGYSLEAQVRVLRDYCKAKTWEILSEFEDAGESARSADRPQLQEALSFVKKNKVDYFVVHKIDRLSRNREDHAFIKIELRKHNVQLVSVVEHIDESPEGQLLEGVMSTMAEFYSKNLARECKKGMIEKLRQGGWPWKAPVGYLNFTFETGEKEVVPDPDKFHQIRAIFELFGTNNYSLDRLAKVMFERGFKNVKDKPLSPQKMKDIIKRRFYSGMIDHPYLNGLEVQGKHKPLITKALWQTCQTILAMRGHSYPSICLENQTDRDFLLRGITYCHKCGNKITGEIKKRMYSYYTCIRYRKSNVCKPATYIPSKILDNKLYELISTIQFKPFVVKIIKANLIEVSKELNLTKEGENQSLNAKLVSLKKRRDDLFNLLLDKTIDKDIYNKHNDRINLDIVEVERRKKGLGQDYLRNIDLISRCIDLMANCRKMYDKFNLTNRKILLQTIFKRIEVNGPDITKIELNQPFEFFVVTSAQRSRADRSKINPLVAPRGIEPRPSD